MHRLKLDHALDAREVAGVGVRRELDRELLGEHAGRALLQRYHLGFAPQLVRAGPVALLEPHDHAQVQPREALRRIGIEQRRPVRRRLQSERRLDHADAGGDRVANQIEVLDLCRVQLAELAMDVDPALARPLVLALARALERADRVLPQRVQERRERNERFEQRGQRPEQAIVVRARSGGDRERHVLRQQLDRLIHRIDALGFGRLAKALDRSLQRAHQPRAGIGRVRVGFPQRQTGVVLQLLEPGRGHAPVRSHVARHDAEPGRPAQQILLLAFGPAEASGERDCLIEAPGDARCAQLEHVAQIGLIREAREHFEQGVERVLVAARREQVRYAHDAAAGVELGERAVTLARPLRRHA